MPPDRERVRLEGSAAGARTAVACQAPEVAKFAKMQPGERPVLGVIEDLAPAGPASAAQCNRAGALLTRCQARCTTKAQDVTPDHYHARWFVKSRQPQRGLTDGIGLRI